MELPDMVKRLKYAARQLMRHPGFALAAILILALGIGANTAIFSMVSAVLLRPLPYDHPDQLVVLQEFNPAEGIGATRVSPATFQDWLAAQQTLVGMAAISEGSFELAGGEEPYRVHSAAVSAGFFDVLGVRLALGSGFGPDEEAGGGEAVAVISHDLWRRRFGGDSAVVGRAIRLGDEAYRVVGVGGRGFEYPSGAEVWTPLAREMPDFGSPRGARFLFVLGRLRRGVGRDAAEADLGGISGRIADAEMEGWRARVVPLQEYITGDVRDALLILLAAVALVLLVACANVANLLLARTMRRNEELAIRAALGAGQARLIGEVLSETLLLALAGGLLGLLLASWGLDLLIAISPQQLPRTDEIGVNASVLVFTAAVSLLTGLLSGIAPSLRFSRPDLAASLRQGGSGRVAGGLRANRVRSGLVVAEVALSLMLLVGAGLLTRSFLTILRVDTGIEPARVLTFDFTLPGYRYADASARLAFGDRALERVRAIPGVAYAGLTRNLPLSGRRMTAPVVVEGAGDELGDRADAEVSSVTPGYFRAMGIRLVAGRTFTKADNERGRPVAVINEALARTYFPGQNPIGRRARSLFGSSEMKEIVGVVADVHHHSPTREAEPTFYQPMAQFPASAFSLVVRAAPEAKGITAAVRAAIGDEDPQLPISRVSSMEALLSRSVAQPRFYTLLLGLFAALALVLAAVGFYAVLASNVSERRREIGIRMALGARMAQVVGMVMREGASLTLVGLALGLAGALALTRVLRGLLFQVSASDPVVFVGVTLLLGLIAGLASFVPARAAARVDPLVTLRE